MKAARTLPRPSTVLKRAIDPHVTRRCRRVAADLAPPSARGARNSPARSLLPHAIVHGSDPELSSVALNRRLILSHSGTRDGRRGRPAQQDCRQPKRTSCRVAAPTTGSEGITRSVWCRTTGASAPPRPPCKEAPRMRSPARGRSHRCCSRGCPVCAQSRWSVQGGLLRAGTCQRVLALDLVADQVMDAVPAK